MSEHDPDQTPMPAAGNVFTELARSGGDEVFDTLFRNACVHVERIVSLGHASPAGFWYDQDHDEWVMLLRGAAVLAFADGSRRSLRAGDWLTIPAGCKHRVAATDADTVWLAVHAGPPRD